MGPRPTRAGMKMEDALKGDQVLPSSVKSSLLPNRGLSQKLPRTVAAGLSAGVLVLGRKQSAGMESGCQGNCGCSESVSILRGGDLIQCFAAIACNVIACEKCTRRFRSARLMRGPPCGALGRRALFRSRSWRRGRSSCPWTGSAKVLAQKTRAAPVSPKPDPARCSARSISRTCCRQPGTF
jgi:hypothetical protein